MITVKKKLKAWNYVKLQKKIIKYQRKGYGYDEIYKNWLFMQCVTMYKEVNN